MDRVRHVTEITGVTGLDRLNSADRIAVPFPFSTIPRIVRIDVAALAFGNRKDETQLTQKLESTRVRTLAFEIGNDKERFRSL